ncbi:MAG TPA: ATP-binding protein [Candidatus Ratteibacteria bacterium]|nr:ATP-binding protein [Candidatus Ratteibacteria bacterium]
MNKLSKTKDVVRYPESENIEYKLNWNDDCLKSISAFANTDGGKLIIGVDNKKGRKYCF